MKDEKEGLVSQSGKMILPFEYNKIAEKGDYIVAYKDNTIIIYDKTLKELLSFDDEGSILVQKIKDGIVLIYDAESDKYGYLNLHGEVLAGCLYESKGIAEMYLNLDGEKNMSSDGCAMLCIGDRCGYINKDGKIVVPIIYSVIVPFYDGTIYAKKQDETWVELDLKRNQKK